MGVYSFEHTNYENINNFSNLGKLFIKTRFICLGNSTQKYLSHSTTLFLILKRFNHINSEQVSSHQDPVSDVRHEASIPQRCSCEPLLLG